MESSVGSKTPAESGVKFLQEADVYKNVGNNSAVGHETLYDYPKYYEIAFGFRDLTAEIDFVERCIERFSKIAVRDILSVGCGTSAHAEELARRGYRYIGLDLNHAMLDYSRDQTRGLKPPPQFHHGNMANFKLPHPCDFAFVMLSSLYVGSTAELRSHFDSLARALNPGALYLLDWCVQFANPFEHQHSEWQVEKDGVTVVSRFQIEFIDRANQIYRETWNITVDDHGHKREFNSQETNRAIYPQEFLFFLENRADFEFVGWWNNWDFNQPLGGPDEISRPVALVRRR